MRKVLITGGSGGIGQSLCEKFQRENYEVYAPKRAELDLSCNNSIDNYISQNANITFDAIVNNAGINPIAFLEEIDDADYDATMQINVKAPYKLIKGFVGNMKKVRYGKIINISSIWGVVSKEKRMTYSTSKNAINGITNTLAVELGEYNILVNSICPGFVNTELTKKNLNETEIKNICKDIPLKRLAEPEEIAEIVYFLASENNTYLSGQKIVVDGGFVVR